MYFCVAAPQFYFRSRSHAYYYSSVETLSFVLYAVFSITDDRGQKAGKFVFGRLVFGGLKISDGDFCLLERVQGTNLPRTYPNHQPCIFYFDQYDTLALSYRYTAQYLEQTARTLLCHIHALEQPCHQHDSGQYQKQTENDLHDTARTDCRRRRGIGGACCSLCGVRGRLVAGYKKQKAQNRRQTILPPPLQ